jgi:hypothetical protein
VLKNLAVIIYPALLAGYYIVYTYQEPIDFAGNTVHCLLVKQPGYVLLFTQGSVRASARVLISVTSPLLNC